MMPQETERLRQKMRKIVRGFDRLLGYADDRGVEGAAKISERTGRETEGVRIARWTAGDDLVSPPRDVAIPALGDDHPVGL